MARRKRRAVDAVGADVPCPVDGAALVEEASTYLQHQRGLPIDGPSGGAGTPPHTRLLFAYAGSEPEQRAFETITSLSCGFGDEVRVLHVREYDICRGGRFFLETPAQARAITLDAVARLRRSGIAASGVVRNADRSDVVRVILDEANEIAACAILLGGRPRGMLLEALLGSVSRRIARRARCPVVLVNVAAFGVRRPRHRHFPDWEVRCSRQWRTPSRRLSGRLSAPQSSSPVWHTRLRSR